MMNIDKQLSDIAVLKELGLRIEKRRVAMNLTQAALAKESGVSKRTIERIEDGSSSEMINIIRISRVLNFIEAFNLLLPLENESPIELIKNKKKILKRASSKRKDNLKSQPWTWSDD